MAVGVSPVFPGEAGAVHAFVDGAFWLGGDEVSVCTDGKCYAKHAPGTDGKLFSAPPRTSSAPGDRAGAPNPHTHV